jgi:hypothetical protein
MPAAQGWALTTQYYTISVADPPPAAGNPRPGARFLASTSQAKGTPLELRTYRPFVTTLQWTPVYPSWPKTGVTGMVSILDMFTDCLPSGCGFGKNLTPRMKFANRFSARCVTVAPVTVSPGRVIQGLVQDGCAEGGDLMARQSWELEQHILSLPTDTRVRLVQPYAGQRRCLTASSDLALLAAPYLCPVHTPWYQSFRFVPVAHVTCVQSRDGMCGMPTPSQVPRG